MKKIVFVLVALIAFNAQAQKGQQNRSEMSPEEMATKRTEQMTSDLDLTEDQQKLVQEINLENSKIVGELRGKRGKDMSDDERSAMRTKMKALQTENQEAMKEVLTEEQYIKWDKMQKEKMEKARGQRGNKKK